MKVAQTSYIYWNNSYQGGDLASLIFLNPRLLLTWYALCELICHESWLKRASYVSSKAASLGLLEKVRVSVKLLSWRVLRRLPGISSNCWNAVDTDLSRRPVLNTGLPRFNGILVKRARVRLRLPVSYAMTSSGNSPLNALARLILSLTRLNLTLLAVLSIGRNAFQSGQCSNGGHGCTQSLMDLSLLFINDNFVNQLSDRKWYCDNLLFPNHHSNN